METIERQATVGREGSRSLWEDEVTDEDVSEVPVVLTLTYTPSPAVGSRRQGFIVSESWGRDSLYK